MRWSRQMTNAQARAKTLILKWFDEGPPRPEVRQRFSTAIDRFFSEIADREAWSECMYTLLGRFFRALASRIRTDVEGQTLPEWPRFQFGSSGLGLRLGKRVEG